MGTSTRIEWTDATWNPITGCSLISEGCQNCYAKRMSQRLAGRYGYPEDQPFRVTFHPDRLGEPLKWKKPKRVFVVSMGDLFHNEVPAKAISDVMDTISQCPQHTFMVLTKRPERMLEYLRGERPSQWALDYEYNLPFPNVWLGVTCENQQRADERIPILLQIPAAVRFVSIEPCLSDVNLERHLVSCKGCGNSGSTSYFVDNDKQLCRACIKGEEGPSLDWVIVGAETGPGARPMNPEWARSIRDQCKETGVPFFMKKIDAKGSPLPDDLNVREWPKLKAED